MGAGETGQPEDHSTLVLRLTQEPPIPFLGRHPQEETARAQTDTAMCGHMNHGGLELGATPVSNHERINKVWSVHKREQHSALVEEDCPVPATTQMGLRRALSAVSPSRGTTAPEPTPPGQPWSCPVRADRAEQRLPGAGCGVGAGV